MMGTHLGLHACLREAVHQVLHWVLVIAQGIYKVLQEGRETKSVNVNSILSGIPQVLWEKRKA